LKSPLFVPLVPLPAASSPNSLSDPSNTPQEPTCHTAMRQAVPSTVPSPAITAQKLQIAAASSTQADSCYRHSSGTPALQSDLMIPGLCTASGILLYLTSNLNEANMQAGQIFATATTRNSAPAPQHTTIFPTSSPPPQTRTSFLS
jgi:hypothetical protein